MTHIGTQTIETDSLLLRKYEITAADDILNWVLIQKSVNFGVETARKY